MIGHQNKIMQEVVSFASIFEHLGDHNICYLFDLEDRNVLSGFGGDEVGPAGFGAMCQATHKIFPQGLKPPCCPYLMSELKLRPPYNPRSFELKLELFSMSTLLDVDAW